MLYLNPQDRKFYIFNLYRMSIAILKKKAIQKRGVSKGEHGFSLNGYRRLNSSSLVGASLNARRRTYTPMKGSAIRGNGSNCCELW